MIHVLSEPESAVLMVGESAGRRLLEGRQEVLLNGELVPVVSHVERFYLWSASSNSATLNV